jgi:oligoendopeptidase F
LKQIASSGQVIELSGAKQMAVHTLQDLQSLIRTCEQAAEHHIALAKRAHTEFQRLFHENRAREALLRADKYRKTLCQLLETCDAPAVPAELGASAQQRGTEPPAGDRPVN